MDDEDESIESKIEDWIQNYSAHDPQLVDALLEQEAREGKNPFFEGLREVCPAFRVKDNPSVRGAVGGADELESVTLNENVWSFEQTVTPLTKSNEPFAPLLTDGVNHREFRRALQPLFSRAEAEKWEDFTRGVVRDLIDEFYDRGRTDVMDNLAVPVPLLVMMEWMGFPREDYERLEDWSRQFFRLEGYEGSGDPEELEEVIEKREGLAEFLMEYIDDKLEERRGNPGDDVISKLTRLEVYDRPFTDEEIVKTAGLLFPAGIETTTKTIGNTVRYLAHHPETQRQLSDDPSLVPGAVEEFLRLLGPVKIRSRTASEETEVGGVKFEEGDRIAIAFGASNRDPERYDSPDEFDPEREARHHGFGSGPHFCLGADLARVELRVVFQELLSTLPVFELDGDVEVLTGPNWGLRTLPISW